MNHQAVHRHIIGHQRMAADNAHGVANAVFPIIEAGEPAIEIDAGVALGGHAVVRNALLARLAQKSIGIQAAHAAIIMRHHHDFFYL